MSYLRLAMMKMVMTMNNPFKSCLHECAHYTDKVVDLILGDLYTLCGSWDAVMKQLFIDGLDGYPDRLKELTSHTIELVRKGTWPLNFDDDDFTLCLEFALLIVKRGFITIKMDMAFRDINDDDREVFAGLLEKYGE